MDPFKKFKLWFSQAKKQYPFDHTAFALSTISSGKPDVRIVLLKLIMKDGYVFFTNLNSSKGKDFKKNNNLSMCFYWENLRKQIRIRGESYLVEKEISDKYFESRPRGSKIGAWASKQSHEIKSFSVLKEKEKLLKNKFRNEIVPRPENWTGIKIYPTEFEFWQKGKSRLHKRELYLIKKNKWVKKILSP